MTKEIMLCAISNISSGTCKEDCGFCTQSTKHHADIERYRYKEIDQIVKEAKAAKANQALGFCLVTAGKGLDDKKLDFVTRAAYAVRKEVGNDLMLIACNGTANLEQLKELKRAGLDSYNHNLETSEAFYDTVCSTHSWAERYQTNVYAKEAGLMLCTGGIFGLGESEEDRRSFVQSIKSLEPFSTPLNFFHPNPALPIKQEPMGIDEALAIIRYVREELVGVRLMIAGGREITFKDRQREIFEAGADAVVIGDYLTTSGEAPQKDIEMIKNLGFGIAANCHG